MYYIQLSNLLHAISMLNFKFLKITAKYSVASLKSRRFFQCAQHGRSLTGASPEHGLIVPNA